MTKIPKVDFQLVSHSVFGIGRSISEYFCFLQAALTRVKKLHSIFFAPEVLMPMVRSHVRQRRISSYFLNSNLYIPLDGVTYETQRRLLSRYGHQRLQVNDCHNIYQTFAIHSYLIWECSAINNMCSIFRKATIWPCFKGFQDRRSSRVTGSYRMTDKP